MSRRDVVRIAAAVVVGALVLVVTDTGPDLLLSAAIISLGASAIWFAKTVGRTAARPVPAILEPAPPTTLPDFRVTALRQALVAGSDDVRHAERVRRQLVEIVDSELLAHGVDRHAEPDVARAVLGDDLHRFVTEPATPSSMTLRHVTDMVTRIEKI